MARAKQKAYLYTHKSPHETRQAGPGWVAGIRVKELGCSPVLALPRAGSPGSPETEIAAVLFIWPTSQRLLLHITSVHVTGGI